MHITEQKPLHAGSPLRLRSTSGERVNHAQRSPQHSPPSLAEYETRGRDRSPYRHPHIHIENHEAAADILRQSTRIHGDVNEDAVMGSQAATVMTSTMIKQSLADLRNKLDRMKRDKEAVSVGIQGYESKYNH